MFNLFGNKKIIRNLSWRPQLPDYRDLILTLDSSVKLPTSIDLRSSCPAVYDQGDLGSCTANAIAGAYEFEKMKQSASYFIPSRLFIYYNERVIEGTVKIDSGAYIRDGIKSVVKQGVCPETEWPYNIKKFKSKPSTKCYKDALKNEVKQYLTINQSLDQFKGCLATIGKPFVFGFTVYSNFMTDSVAQTGIMIMPQAGDSIEGGHAVCCVGYDDNKKMFIIRNSWGTTWGDQGYFYMPYAYMINANLCSDFWTIELVS
jgi:C1A family cysteine protease